MSDRPIEIDERIIKSNAKHRQSASQMWTLVRILPFLVGDLLPEENENYRCFCLLLKISNIATSREINLVLAYSN